MHPLRSGRDEYVFLAKLPIVAMKFINLFIEQILPSRLPCLPSGGNPETLEERSFESRVVVRGRC